MGFSQRSISCLSPSSVITLAWKENGDHFLGADKVIISHTNVHCNSSLSLKWHFLNKYLQSICLQVNNYVKWNNWLITLFVESVEWLAQFEHNYRILKNLCFLNGETKMRRFLNNAGHYHFALSTRGRICGILISRHLQEFFFILIESSV